MSSEKTDNELIAEFMGMRIEKTKSSSGKDWYRGFCFYPEYKNIKEWSCAARTKGDVEKSLKAFAHQYDTSWNWLMPVVEKIERLGHKVAIEEKDCVIFKSYGAPVSQTGNWPTKIAATHRAVSGFIRWYNMNSKATV